MEVYYTSVYRRGELKIIVKKILKNVSFGPPHDAQRPLPPPLAKCISEIE